MLSEPVPVTGLAENFSSTPRIAPPPLGRFICGGVNGEASALEPFPPISPVVPFSAMACPSSTKAPCLRVHLESLNGVLCAGQEIRHGQPLSINRLPD